MARGNFRMMRMLSGLKKQVGRLSKSKKGKRRKRSRPRSRGLSLGTMALIGVGAWLLFGMKKK